MKNLFARSTIFAGALAALVLGVAAPAQADTVSDAVAAFESGATSYVAPGIGGTPVDPGFASDGVAVVVMEVNGNATMTPSQYATQIQGQLGSQYHTVIVVNADSSNNQAYGVVPGTSSQAILPILSGGNGVANLNAKQGEISSALATTTTVQDVNPGGTGFDAAPVVVGGGLILALAVIGTLVALAIKRARSKKVKAVTTTAIKNNQLKTQLEKFADIIERYRELKFNEFADALNDTLKHINDLFARLERKGTQSQKNMAEVEYAATLERLTIALDEDYYVDIVNNPKLWDRPHERLEEVRRAAAAVDTQVIENIKQINSSRDLDLSVALDAILRSVDQPNAQEMIAKPAKRKF